MGPCFARYNVKHFQVSKNYRTKYNYFNTLVTLQIKEMSMLSILLIEAEKYILTSSAYHIGVKKTNHY